MKSTDNKDYNEIDLNEIPKKIGKLFEILRYKVNMFFVFLVKNAKFLIPLLILGFGLGFFLDTRVNSYKHEVIVIPNLESTDYLYSKIELINSKIKLKDTVFFEEIQLDKDLKLSRISISPISDPFLLVDEKREYLDLIKLLLDNGDPDKFLESETMIRKFKTHKLEFVSKLKIQDNNQIIENIIDFLNKNEFYNQKRKQEVLNIENSIAQYNLMNEQANDVLKSINNRDLSNQKNENISINNEFISYNEVLKVKEEMLENKNELSMDLVLYDKTIKDIQISKNLIGSKYFKGYSKFLFPFLFVLFYLMSFRISKFMTLYRSLKTENN